MEIFLNRVHMFDMLDRRCIRPTPRYLAHIPPIYIVLVATAHFAAVEWTVTTPLCYWLQVLCGGGGENHHRNCGGHTSLCARYGEPPMEPLNSAANTGLDTTLLLWNVEI